MMAPARPAATPVRRLSGYKEIAAHIEHLVGWSVAAATVRRWARRPKHGVPPLPVQCPSATQVVALPADIDAWCARRWPDIIARTRTQ